MNTKNVFRFLVVAGLFAPLTGYAQSASAPMKNSSVVSMVKGGLPDGTITGIISSSKTQFDVTPGGQAALKESGVSPAVIQAMVAAEERKTTAAPAASPTPVRAGPGAKATPSPAARPPEPYVLFGEGGGTSSLPTEQAQVAVVKSNKKELSALAADGALAQALQVAAQQSAAQAGAGASTSSSLGSAAGALASGLFQRRAPTVTFLWGVAGKPTTEIPAAQAQRFEVAFAAVSGISVGDFAPVLVRLVPAQNDWRLVGATQAKEEAAQSAIPDWDLYEKFIEEKIPASVSPTSPGKFEIKPSAALGPGEYAIVLRPVAKNKRFTGQQVLGNVGEGQLFNRVWRFTVKP